MKGRIIGRDGRNIRSFENATGITVLVDDTPNAVVLSGFDPVRREVARQSMERLILDGRIHPTRIEELVEQTKRDIEEKIVKVGNEAVVEADVRGLHPKVIEALGKIALRPAQQRACGSDLCGIHQLWIGFLQHRSSQISKPTRLKRVSATGRACIPAGLTWPAIPASRRCCRRCGHGCEHCLGRVHPHR